MNNDPVNHPSHYTSNASGIEIIEVTRNLDFDLGNAWKYLCRFRLKNKPVEDLHKAVWYLNDYVAHHNFYDLSEDNGSSIGFTALASNTRLCQAMHAMIYSEENDYVKNALILISNFALFNSPMMLDEASIIRTLDSKAEDICEDIVRAAKEKEVMSIAAQLLTEEKSDVSCEDYAASSTVRKIEPMPSESISAACAEAKKQADLWQELSDNIFQPLSASDIELINTDVEDYRLKNSVCDENVVSCEDVIQIVKNSKTGDVIKPGDDVKDIETMVELVQLPKELLNKPYKDKLDYAINCVTTANRKLKPTEEKPKRKRGRTKKSN